MSRIRATPAPPGHRRLADHERARRLAAERLDGPTSRTHEAAWLDEHLVGCSACRAVALGLRGGPGGPARPARAARRSRRGTCGRGPRPPSNGKRALPQVGGGRRAERRRSATRRPALGVLSGIAVIAVVIGATVMSGGSLAPPSTDRRGPDVAARGRSPAGRPVPDRPRSRSAPASSGWVGTSADGRSPTTSTAVDEVCAVERQPDCARSLAATRSDVDLTIHPKSISQSPVRNQAVVVGYRWTGDDAVMVIALPTAEPTATPVPTPTAPTGSTTPAPADDLGRTPASTSPSRRQRDTRAGSPARPRAADQPDADAYPDRRRPTLAIVSGVRVVGEVGRLFARWRVVRLHGPPVRRHRPVRTSTSGASGTTRPGRSPTTTSASSDRGSGASSSAAGRSAPTAARTSRPVRSSSTRRPASETALEAPVWRPVVDPERPLGGRLGRDRHDRPGDAHPGPGRRARSCFAVTAVTASRSTVATAPVAEGDVTEFDVRWDETGTWLAIWIADETDPSIGQSEPPPRRPGVRGRGRDRTVRPRMSPRCLASPSPTVGWRGPLLQGRAARAAGSRSWRGPMSRSAQWSPARSRTSWSSTRGAVPVPACSRARSGVWSASRATPRLVVGSVLTAALALVALPGLAGSRAPSPIEPVPAGAFQQLTIPADDSRSTISISSLDDADRSAGAIDAAALLVEPGAATADAATGRTIADQPKSTASSVLKGANRRRSTGPALHPDRWRDVLRQRHDGDAPAARHGREDLRQAVAASCASSTTTGRRRRAGSSTSTGPTSSPSAAVRRGPATTQVTVVRLLTGPAGAVSFRLIPSATAP